jgi:hypothetical protein
MEDFDTTELQELPAFRKLFVAMDLIKDAFWEIPGAKRTSDWMDKKKKVQLILDELLHEIADPEELDKFWGDNIEITTLGEEK